VCIFSTLHITKSIDFLFLFLLMALYFYFLFENKICWF
jgi:hypothetical protein